MAELLEVVVEAVIAHFAVAGAHGRVVGPVGARGCGEVATVLTAHHGARATPILATKPRVQRDLGLRWAGTARPKAGSLGKAVA